MGSARRGGNSKNKMSHSIKKVMRRTGVAGMKGKRKKLKAPVHPGSKGLSKHAMKLRESEGDKEMTEAATATAKRVEAHAQQGRQSRLDLIQRRRGVEVGGTAMALAGQGMADAPQTEEEMAAAAAAGQAAKSALAFAPANQRTFHKELAIVLKAADVLLEVIDARDPMGCRCVALEDAVMQRFTNKRIILILNKVDLVPPDVTQRWLTYLRQYFPTLPFKASTQKKGEMGSAAGAGKLSSYGSEAYGGDQLLQLLKNYARSRNLKTAVTVGLLGYPNVGKSSVINSLKRARAVSVGATPGLTTHAQTISLDKNVKLMDCPGIVFARAVTEEEQADVALRNAVRVEKLEDPSVPVAAILRRVPATQLEEQYGVASFAGVEDFLTLVAAKRGHLRKGGAADQDAAARAVLIDWNNGAIKYHTEPPANAAAVEVVPYFAEGFDWNAAPKVEEPEADGKPDRPALPPSAGKSAAGVYRNGARAAHDRPPAPGRQERGPVAMEDEQRGEPSLLDGYRAAQQRESRESKAAKAKPAAERAAARARKAAAADEDDRYNFQPNREIRKKQKEQKKKARKTAGMQMHF